MRARVEYWGVGLGREHKLCGSSTRFRGNRTHEQMVKWY